MSVSWIDYIFEFDRSDEGLSGTVAVLNAPTENPQQAALVFARYTDCGGGKALEIRSDKGIWCLSVPTEKGCVDFEPQLGCLTVTDDTCGEVRRISFANKKAIAELNKSLKKDKQFFPAQGGFLKALVHVLPDLETTCYIEFDLLNDGRGVAKLSGEERRRRRRKKRRRHEWEFQVGWDVQDFIDCMSECEEDCSWWEIWWHAWCLAKCLVKCATG